MADSIWAGDDQTTIPELFTRRLEADPDGEYIDMGGEKLTARSVMDAAARFGGALEELGTRAA